MSAYYDCGAWECGDVAHGCDVGKHFAEGWHDLHVRLRGECLDCPMAPEVETASVEMSAPVGVGLPTPGRGDSNWQQLRDLMTSRATYCRQAADDTWEGGRGAASRRWKLRYEADVTEAWLARMDVLERQP